MIAFFISAGISISAQSDVDSLRQVLEELPNDTSRLPVLKNIVRLQVFVLPDSALPYALEYYELASITNNPVLKGEGANFIGMCYQMSNDHESSLKYYIRSLEHFKKGDDPWYTAMLHNNIGAIHEREARLETARKWFKKALEQFSAIDDKVWMANVSNNLANIFYHEEQFDSAVFHYAAIIEVLSSEDMPVYISAARMNLANTLMALGSLDSALVQYRRSLELLPQSSDDNSLANTLVNMGECYYRIGEPDTALIYLIKGNGVALKGGMKEVLINGHYGISEAYHMIGRNDSALVHLKASMAWRDSVHSESKSARITEMQEKYDSQQKDLEIERNKAALEKGAFQNKALAGGAALLLLVVVFGIRAYLTKKRGNERLAEKNEQIEKALDEKELLLKEIHHRVKNNLQVVSSLLSLQSRKISDEKAKEAITASRNRVKSMALIHQNLYKEDDLTGIDLADYVEKLANSLVSSYQVDEDKIKVNTDVQHMSLDVDTTIPIGLILNELITNALKYAFPEGRAGTVDVSLKRQNDELLLEVKDDGVGYDPDALRGEESSSFGFNMINAFARKLKAEWEVRNENGTVVSMRISKFKVSV